MRKHRFIDCNPRWSDATSEHPCHIRFDCPEGHKECTHTIRVDPAKNADLPKPEHGTYWYRTGDDFQTMSLTPSIRRIPVFKSREAALKAGCKPEHISDTLLCALHIHIKDGKIEFCKDSK